MMSGWRRWAVLGAVATAVAVIVGLKISAEAPPPSAVAPSTVEAAVRVTLVADLREAESSCGCGEIIRTAREAAGIDGVEFREIDPRSGAEEMARLGVHVAPTVLIWPAEGGELRRFEGESPTVVEDIREAVAQLATMPDSK